MRLLVVRLLPAIGLVALALSACDINIHSGEHSISGGKATLAEGPNARPNYIFPLTSGAYFSPSNVSQFQFLMYRPLYSFGENGQVKLNSGLSLAADPIYGSDGKTVTMKLKGWKWSDGTVITSRDVEFWMNLLKANVGHWAAYAPGEFPDNVTRMTFPDSQTIVFGLDKAYGHLFFTYNELSQITPLPQHVWDKISDSGTVGDFDRDTNNATAVYNYLDSQSRSIGTYQNNPLWQVVSGPWKLKSMTSDGAVAMIPNQGYSGPVRPTLAEFDEQPYTSDTAEFSALHAGGIDLGYIPVWAVGQKDSLPAFTFKPWVGWQLEFLQENYANATNGLIYKQLYFRQAMQHLVDQLTWIRDIYKGYASPEYGPVPISPQNNFADSFAQHNPYPYDPLAAVKLLQDNGWTVNVGGVSTCSTPGIGTGQCGAGIAAGAKASFKLEYASGSVFTKQEMTALKNAFSKAGLEVSLSEAPFDTVIADAFGRSTIADMDNWGLGWIFAPDYYPTGDEIFSTGAAFNGGGYSSSTNDANTIATTLSDEASVLQKYQDFLATDLPVIWLPSVDYQLTMARKTLHGWETLDPLLQIYPESWYLTGSS